MRAVSSRRLAAAFAISMATLLTSGAAVVIAVNRAESSPAVSGSVTRPGPSTSPSPSPTPRVTKPTVPTLTVNGSRIRVGTIKTAGAAVRAAGITIKAGRYLSVVHHRRLHSNGQPGGVSVNGHRATLRTRVHAGDVIVVHEGPSRLEPTEKVLLRLHPVVPSALYVGAHNGLARVVRGTISHEVVRSQVIEKPRAGHLITPGAVALTFDDGPSRRWTRRVLDLLRTRHVHATFCEIGRQIAEHAAVVRRLVRDGNALCDHTWDHDEDLRGRSRGRQALDIQRGFHAIARWSGERPRFFRAPGGNWSTPLETIARAKGMRPLKWTVDPRDWARPGVHAIVHKVLAELRPGGVILLHDGGGNRRQTLLALKVLLHRLPKLGYRFVLPPG
jgi:peptidoglycan/xylan/chitin deacetylase (PgdA/CDA1 family)